ncbi:MAG: endonuclease/exonuclease/phosphatase family protein [Alphaproteobacteria bacterium]|nr:endonuclease/exonuclease/phosphatase family protein [Alphaproteobacteria bacterium]
MRALSLLLATACGAAAPTGPDTDLDLDTGLPRAFVPLEDDGTVPDHLGDRLCDEAAAPDAAPDPVHLHCRTEGARFAPADAVPDGPLTVMVWNLERGQRLDAQLAAWADGTLPVPDVLLAAEVDRGCTRSGDRNVPREIAQALGLDYVFGVEFLELPRPSGGGGRIDAPCEHGNAIFSRFPLGNVEARFHTTNLSWYVPPDERGGPGEPRLGGRSFLLADMAWGDTLVRLSSLHFESRVIPPEVQWQQGEELAAALQEVPGPVLAGGDTNAGAYSFDLASGRTAPDEVEDRTIGPLLRAGLDDAHLALPVDARPTRSGLIIDLLFGRGLGWSAPTVCPAEVCDPLSDHRAVWAEAGLLPR